MTPYEFMIAYLRAGVSPKQAAAAAGVQPGTARQAVRALRAAGVIAPWMCRRS
jgi:hypothetical protein